MRAEIEGVTTELLMEGSEGHGFDVFYDAFAKYE